MLKASHRRHTYSGTSLWGQNIFKLTGQKLLLVTLCYPENHLSIDVQISVLLLKMNTCSVALFV